MRFLLVLFLFALPLQAKERPEKKKPTKNEKKVTEIKKAQTRRYTMKDVERRETRTMSFYEHVERFTTQEINLSR